MRQIVLGFRLFRGSILANEHPIVDHGCVHLNERAWKRCDQMVAQAAPLRVSVMRDESGARLIDCGIHAPGGLEAGLTLSEICLANLGRVRMVPGNPALWPGPAITVTTDHPVAACMASQYAGWQVAGEKFFAMGSGPMRARRGREPLFHAIGIQDEASCAVGVLESRQLPPGDVCHHIAEECRLGPERLTLLVAPTASLAGSVQVVARSVETALHKMHEIGFDLQRVVSGFGVAPLPPVAADDLSGIGRTNDAVLYGGEVTLWVRGDDQSLSELGPRIPSSASPDHGQPFGEIFQRYDRDFYKIDPMLFSPAVINLVNLDSGRSHRFGATSSEVLSRSFNS
ncbi:MAG: methenyltetrahydromethanopterin cyclohydrolase [Pirellulaceae bacterium]